MKKIQLLLLALFVCFLQPIRAGEPRTAESAVTPTDPSRHGNFLREIKAANGDFNFLLIGDSITDYWPGKGKDTYAAFLPWKPLNLGVSGEHTEHVLFRLTNGELDGIHPKAAMIMIGTNNLGHSGDEKPEWTAAGVKKIVETVRAKLPDTKILLLAIFPRSPKATDSIRQRVVETNKLIAPIADNKMVFFKDISEKFLDAEGNLSPELMPDYLHPSAKGYQVWLDAVKPKLDELMK
jgi:lysophospholipase L1-like esterase